MESTSFGDDGEVGQQGLKQRTENWYFEIYHHLNKASILENMCSTRIPVTLLRVKRKRNARVADSVHVRVAKRQRLTTTLQSLSLQTPHTPHMPQDAPPSRTEEQNSECVVFRRVRFVDDVKGPARSQDSTDLIMRDLQDGDKDVRIVDVDDMMLQHSGQDEKPSDHQVEGVAHKPEDKQSPNAESDEKSALQDEGVEYDMFVRAGTAPSKLPLGFRQHMALGQVSVMDNEEECVAYVDGADLFAEGLLDIGSDNSEDEDVDLSDYDAHTVDYPSTPEESSDGCGSDSDGSDYQRYERYQDDVDYDTTC